MSETAAGRDWKAWQLWPLLLPLLLLLPGVTGFPYPGRDDALYSDLAISHYPYALQLQRALLAGRVPLWSESILSGAPLLANPLSGMTYPPGWAALLLPLPLGFNLALMAHLLLGGVGMYCLLRAEDGLFWRSSAPGHPAALFGALAFELLPKWFAHYGAGHLTLAYAVPWTPWLVLAARRRRGEALVLALVWLADLRWGFYATLLWAAYALAAGRAQGLRLPAVAGRMAGRLALAVLLSAPLLLPLAEFVNLSSRAQMQAQDFFEYSLPPVRVLGLFFHDFTGYMDFTGYHEYVVYAGLAVLFPALLALIWMRALPAARFWGAAAGLALAYAFGSNLPLWAPLARLPLMDLLRVPARALFITGLALAALAAYGVQQLLDGPTPAQGRTARLTLTALAGLILALTAGVWAATGELPVNFIWGACFGLLLAVWIGLRLGGRLAPRTWLAGLLVIGLVELGVVDATLFRSRPAQAVLAEGGELAAALGDLAAGGDFRVYSPSYSLPQQTAAYHELQLADGIDPLQLRSYIAFMDRASGVPRSGYSVTLPPLANGDPASDNAAYRPDPALLGLLRVRFVAAEFDLDGTPGLERVWQTGQTRLYAVQAPREQAWVEAEPGVSANNQAPVEITAWTPEAMQVRASGPGRLVFSEVLYPGWRAWLDGKPVQLDAYEGLLRSVILPPGEHDVRLVFRPLSLYLGLALFLVGVGLMIWRKTW